MTRHKVLAHRTASLPLHIYKQAPASSDRFSVVLRKITADFSAGQNDRRVYLLRRTFGFFAGFVRHVRRFSPSLPRA
jgi:hypothetical protein